MPWNSPHLQPGAPRHRHGRHLAGACPAAQRPEDHRACRPRRRLRPAGANVAGSPDGREAGDERAGPERARSRRHCRPAGFANSKEREPALLVAGLGMVGAININKSPVTLDQVTPLARLQGEYQPLFVAANSPIKTVNDLLAKFKENPGSVSWGGFAPGSPDHLLSGLVVKAGGGDVKKMNYVPVGTGGEMLPLVISGKVTVATGGLNEVAGQLKTGRLRAIGISSPERLPGVDIPTFKEQGIDTTLVNWRGLMAPPPCQRTRRRWRTCSPGWSRAQRGGRCSISENGSTSTCRRTRLPPSSKRSRSASGAS